KSRSVSSDCPVVYLTASLTCKYLELPEILLTCNRHLICSAGQILSSELCPVTPSPSVIQTPGSTLSGSIASPRLRRRHSDEEFQNLPLSTKQLRSRRANESPTIA